eukprot:CAMPEP_0201521688 /NCGR_PEP_ID=MMETSP0161_2-20130828/15650_1 /ASSEMBLY_ACC=CAM_ASM_000251 /TAXON_ID=180227 /ORGANISM="Neoparamoeba aestuarina, Strain SoJaBio B1-5/56/2" /LENGTH=164 /DNA_ID=CAMNT_0047920369 /DNA_START=138 /DNA_END=632 /DNA_ORIENTATION=-
MTKEKEQNGMEENGDDEKMKEEGSDESGSESEYESDSDSDSDSDDEMGAPSLHGRHERLRFRNYKPRHPDLKPYVLKIEEKEEQKDLAQDLTLRLSKLSEVKGEDIIYLAPKKANWDLKRDISSKMDRLEKMTMLSIFSLATSQHEQQPPKRSAIENKKAGDLD